MSTPKIVVDDVSKRFRLFMEKPSSLKESITARSARWEEFWALRNISFEVPEGSTYGLIGHNGSGKSTMLRCVAGIYEPTSGTVTSSGRISALLELGSGFHPDLSGRENVYLNAAILGMGKKEIDGVFDEIVDFAGIGQFIDSPVKVYSSGMFVRLGFSVAVHVNPEILIIDEVVAVGDEDFQRRCFDHIYKLRREGVTIVMVTHNLGLVQTMCDGASWFDHGELRAEGDALEVCSAYLAKVNRDEEAKYPSASSDANLAATGEMPPRWGSGEIRITSVDWLDGDGREMSVATANEPLKLRIGWKATSPVEQPVFGWTLHLENGQSISGSSTRQYGVDTGVLEGCGTVEFALDHCPFFPGTYDLSVAISDHHLQHIFDRFDRSLRLTVRPGSQIGRFGAVDVPGRWSIGRGPLPEGARA